MVDPLAFTPQRARSGALLQSSVPKSRPRVDVGDTNGLLLKGVVTATYVYDSPERLNSTAAPVAGTTEPARNAIYCDVWCYGNTYRGHLAGVLVAQPPGSGLHQGRVWKPRAATLDISGAPIDLNLATNPSNLDGDHVLVGFLEQRQHQPIILGCLPHPSSDIGHELDESGHRMRLKLLDGDPDFHKHLGAFYGVNKDGNFVVDLTKAHQGTYLPDGQEPQPTLVGASGNYRILLPKNSTLSIEIEDGAAFEIEDKEGAAKLTLGDGTVHVAIVEHLQALWTELKLRLDAFDVGHASQLCGVGPVTPPPPVAAPAWNASINSSKMSLPDG